MFTVEFTEHFNSIVETYCLGKRCFQIQISVLERSHRVWNSCLEYMHFESIIPHEPINITRVSSESSLSVWGLVLGIPSLTEPRQSSDLPPTLCLRPSWLRELIGGTPESPERHLGTCPATPSHCLLTMCLSPRSFDGDVHGDGCCSQAC